MEPLPVPEEKPETICIHVTSLRAVHPQPVPVITLTRPSVASGPAEALVGETERLEGEPSCVIVNTGACPDEVVLIAIDPLRLATQAFGATVNATDPSEARHVPGLLTAI